MNLCPPSRRPSGLLVMAALLAFCAAAGGHDDKGKKDPDPRRGPDLTGNISKTTNPTDLEKKAGIVAVIPVNDGKATVLITRDTCSAQMVGMRKQFPPRP